MKYAFLIFALLLNGCGRNANTLVSDLVKPEQYYPQLNYQSGSNHRRIVIPPANLPFDLVVLIDQTVTATQVLAVEPQVVSLIQTLNMYGISYQLTLVDSSGHSQGPNPIVQSNDSQATTKATADLEAIRTNVGRVPVQGIPAALESAIDSPDHQTFFRANAYRSFIVVANDPQFSSDWAPSNTTHILNRLDNQASPYNWSLSAYNFAIGPECPVSQMPSVNPSSLAGLVQFGTGQFSDCGSTLSHFFTLAEQAIPNQASIITIRNMVPDPLNTGWHNTYANIYASSPGGTSSYTASVDTDRWTMHFYYGSTPAPGSLVDLALIWNYGTY